MLLAIDLPRQFHKHMLIFVTKGLRDLWAIMDNSLIIKGQNYMFFTKAELKISWNSMMISFL